MEKEEKEEKGGEDGRVGCEKEEAVLERSLWWRLETETSQSVSQSVETSPVR